MYYIVAVPLFCFLAFQIFRLNEMRKHDTHLFRFCELRRDCIDLMGKEYQSLSRNDYVALRKLVEVLNVTINKYKNHKTVLFDFRLFTRYLGDLKSVEARAEKISTKNSDIRQLIERMQVSVLAAFLAFTPFLKSEILGKVIARILAVATNTGMESLKKNLASVKEANALVKQYKQADSLSC
jgi:hypothetical protein